MTEVQADPESTARLRAELEASPLWREAFRAQNPRMLEASRDRVVEMRAFDIDEWVHVAPGGVYEYWFSERGHARRQFRTADLRGIMICLVQAGLASAGKWVLRSSAYDRPPGFRLSQSGDGPIVVEWDDDGWAEFEGARPLRSALTFAWLMLADPDDLAASVRSGDGAPLMLVGSALQGEDRPTGLPTLQSWKTWLAEREVTADV